MNAEKLDQMWESSIVNADKKTVFDSRIFL